MRMLGLLFGALLLAVAGVSPGSAVPLPFNPVTTVFTWSDTNVPASVGFRATGNASFDAATRSLFLPVTGVDSTNPARDRVLHRDSGLEVSIPTSLTGLPAPLTYTLSDWVFVFDRTPADNNVISAIVSGPTVATPARLQFGNFAPLATVPGVFFVPLHPDAAALLTQVLGTTVPAGIVIGGFTQVPVPAALTLFATLGLALLGLAALQRRRVFQAAA